MAILTLPGSASVRRGVLFVALLALVGCGGSDGVNPVTGTVRHKGKPLVGATVAFIPTNPGPNQKVAIATTDAEGKFQLVTPLPGKRTGSGAAPGDYKVTVSKFIPPKGMSDAEYQKKVDADNAIRAKGGYNPETTIEPKVEGIPPEYSDQKKTKLTATVGSSTNDFTFEIP